MQTAGKEDSHARPSRAILFERARKGDRNAFDALFALAAGRILYFIRLRLGKALHGQIESMDVLQDAYLDAYTSFEHFKESDDKAFVRWICRIAEHRIHDCKDYFDAKKRRPPHGMHAVSRVLQLAKESGTGPLTAAERADTRERLARAMERLEEEEREVLVKRHFESMTIEEIGHAMGRSETAVRRLLGRATVRLGRVLAPADSETGAARG
ncbi:MAG TPA: hypothetical protein DCM87_21100 [Planctomycetes bacterium]|nr:hypothetical protein [Planctomycetota bacterium]